MLALFGRNGLLACKAKPPASYGWFSPYDGNIIGGALVGAGMALTDACPGTVLLQLITGIPSARYVLLGGLLGGIIFTRLSPSLHRPPSQDQPRKFTAPPALTLPAKLHTDPTLTLLAYDALCAACVALAQLCAPSTTHPLGPVLSGLLIGAAQLASAALTRLPLGVSSAYEEAGHWFWRLAALHHTPAPAPAPATKALTFVAGMLAGSWALVRAAPGFAETRGGDVLRGGAGRALLGGGVLVFGARVAGGCPSGHGISGMAMLGVASVVSVVSMFVGGIAVGLLVG